MISVKDQEVMQKRDAFLYTINQHKKLAQTHQNAVFSSTKGRFDLSQPIPEGFASEMPPSATGTYASVPPDILNRTGRGKFD